jgi:glycosyltransferase involved in cell wall biosynthesis
MNILVLHSSSDLYGASKMLLVITEVLQQRGHTVQVVLSTEGPLSDALRAKQVTVHIIPLGILRRKYMTPAGMLNRAVTLKSAVRKISTLIRKEKIDLVYSNTTAVLAGAMAAKKTHTRHIWHIHEILEQSKWLFRIISGLVKRYSDVVIVVSDAVKTSWSKLVAPEKIHVVYNGIDYTPFLNATGNEKAKGIPTDKMIIGMIGRVHHWKGQDYFLQIASILIKKYPQLHFVMAGDVFPGNEYLYAKLEAIKKENGLHTCVTDLGYRTDIPELLRSFDIFVLPSTKPDPFPTVILEAMAAARPVAATRMGGAPEMIEDGISGWLIPHDDAGKAASILETLICDTALQTQSGEMARERVLSVFSKQKFADTLIKLVE